PPTHHISYNLSLHDALPISLISNHRKHLMTCTRLIVRQVKQSCGPRAKRKESIRRSWPKRNLFIGRHSTAEPCPVFCIVRQPSLDRKSTRLNSSHLGISYAV